MPNPVRSLFVEPSPLPNTVVPPPDESLEVWYVLALRAGRFPRIVSPLFMRQQDAQGFLTVLKRREPTLDLRLAVAARGAPLLSRWAPSADSMASTGGRTVVRLRQPYGARVPQIVASGRVLFATEEAL